MPKRKLIYFTQVEQQKNRRPKKALGQNFLLDQNIARNIVKLLNIVVDDFVVEIGPGPGALTQKLILAQPSRLLLVEKDYRFALERARNSLVNPLCPTNVLLADALRLVWGKFSNDWKCIGNLPYNIASPFLWTLLSSGSGLRRAVFMVQKEVGLRLAAQPGTSAYGALSVWVQTFSSPRLEFFVPPHVFSPRPKVYSAVVSFVPHRQLNLLVPENLLAQTIKLFFQMRRKQLATIIRGMNKPVGLLEALEINPMWRPENLTPTQFQQIAANLFFDKTI